MKYITKTTEPTEFTTWKETWRSTGIEPGWAEFDGTSMKQTVKAELLDEQGHLCCFCEAPVEMKSGHIAHLLDRHNHSTLALDYDNLLYSCPENPHNTPQTCGHAQGNKILPITPLHADCETYFAYTEDGRIHGKDNKAGETIRILNLNGSKQLCESRRIVYEETQAMILSNKWSRTDLERQDGMFKPFWTTIKYAAGLYT
jgi:uncharacterized protein (TIGR02646 family)